VKRRLAPAFLLLACLALLPPATARAQIQSRIVMDLDDGYRARPVYELDPDGVPRLFVDVTFPEYARGDAAWTFGVRAAMTKLLGCEAFKGCSPRLMLFDYSSQDLVTLGAETEDGRAVVFAWRLAASPEDGRTVGASFLIETVERGGLSSSNHARRKNE
jgi:hypothetical protein